MKVKVNNTQAIFSKDKKMMGERNDCAVRATAVLLNQTYNETHEQYRKVGRKNLKGVRTYMIEDVLSSKLIGFNNKTVCEYLEAADWNRRSTPTIKTVLKDKKFQSGSHMMITRNHVFAVVNGEIYGNSNDDGRARVQGYYTVDTGIIS